MEPNPNPPAEAAATPAPAQAPVAETPAPVAETPAPAVEAPAPEVTAAAQTTAFEMVLPLSVATRADLGRLARELDLVEDFFHQAAIRGGEASKTMPKVSAKLAAISEANQINLLRANDRASLKGFLARLKAKAPVVHMSFAGEASADFMASLLTWFRTNAHPYVVLHIGLQPELAAGFTMRTYSKAFDFSLRKAFDKNKDKLVSALEKSLSEAKTEGATA